MSDLEKNYSAVLKKIANTQKQPLLIAVSKTQPVEKMMELYRLGHHDFGENYVQELIEKAKVFQKEKLDEVRFHFIGRLQSNKVKSLLPWVQSIHSVDSISLLKEIEKRAESLSIKIDCYFQVNIDDEPSKGGFKSDELGELADQIKNYSFAVPAGLMAIPNPELSSERAFVRMGELSKQWKAKLGAGLSMGMSEDFETAIRCGSTAVRVGSSIFGPRHR